jgi:hypothetical protein
VHGEEAEGGDAGSRFRILTFYPFRIPYPVVNKEAPDTGSRIRNTVCVCREKKQKAVMREKEILCRILTFYPSRIPDPGAKKALDPGSATL